MLGRKAWEELPTTLIADMTRLSYITQIKKLLDLRRSPSGGKAYSWEARVFSSEDEGFISGSEAFRECGGSKDGGCMTDVPVRTECAKISTSNYRAFGQTERVGWQP